MVAYSKVKLQKIGKKGKKWVIFFDRIGSFLILVFFADLQADSESAGKKTSSKNI
jgi:hypothetical protein